MAATYEEARDLLSAFVTTNWNVATSSAPLLYDNLNADRPATPSLFGRLNIQHVSGMLAALGASRFRRMGVLSVQVFVPLGSGTQQADQVAESLVEALEGVGPTTLENVWLRNIGMREVGPDGTYHQVNVEADFTFDRVV
ncbi:MAG: phage tail terminator-like protein [Gemmatimonadota bacterium]